jgi:O-antigen/teichoic acid export membrane protein
MLLFGIVIFISGTAVMMEYVLLLEQRLTFLVWFSILHYTAHIIAVAGAFAWGNGIADCVNLLIALNLLRFVLLVGVVFGKKIYKPKKGQFVKLMIGASPLIVAALFSGSVEYISGFFVSGFMGESEFALYRYGAKELPLTLLLANAFSAALIPQIAEASKDWRIGLQPIKKSTATHIGLLFPFCAVLMVASPFIYPTVFNPEFAESASVFNIFLLLVISRFVFPQSILLGLGYRRAIVQGSVLELGTAIVLGLALGYVWGINGVALSVVLASFAEKAYLIYRVNKIEKVSASQYIPIKTWIICSVGLVAVFIAVHFWFFT